MGIKSGLTQKQSQKLSLSAHMRQSLEILQMDTIALKEKIDAELEINPMLEVASDEEEDLAAAHMAQAELAWFAGTESEDHFAQSGEASEHPDALSYLAGPAMSLHDHLLAQLSLSRVAPELVSLARYIIHCLDSNGWLPESAQTIGEELGEPLDQVEAAIRLVQSMEPAGICARSLRECLLLQARRLELGQIVLTVIEEHLPDLAAKRIDQIAKAMGVGSKDIYQAVKEIQALEPRPGAAFAAAGDTVYVTPDASLRLENGSFALTIGSGLLPALRISVDYQHLLSVSDDPQVTAYLTACLKQARSLIDSLAQRNRTLTRCLLEMIRRQPDYFQDCRGYLKPMTMSEIAEAVGLSVSTVSRAMKDKYIQCCHGLVPLSALFTSAMPGGPDGDNVSSQQLRMEIRRLIENEDSHSPLSDQDIAQTLAAKGYAIARRTVAKYRSEMRLPAAPQRRIV